MLDRRHAADAGSQILEHSQKGDSVFRLGDKLQSQFRDDSQGSLRTDHQVHEGIAGTVFAGLAAQLHHTAVRKHHRHGTDIFTGAAVFHGPHATGVGSYVAAHRGEPLAGVGRIKHTAFCAGRGQVSQQDAGFNVNKAVLHIPAENMIHLGQINDNTAADRRAAAAEPGSGPAGDDGDVVLVQNFAGFGNIFRRLCQNYGVRHTETGGYHLIMGIVFGELVPAQDAPGERGGKLCKYFRGKGLK